MAIADPDAPEGLEALYSHRHRIRNYDGFLERWPRASALAAANHRMLADRAYGDHPLERYDAFPAGPEAPVLVFFHGGYWHSQDKGNFLFPAPAFVAAGVAFVGANYPLCPAVRMTELVDSCRRCVAHVRTHAAEFGGDPERIHVCGHSAGGHIAALLLATAPVGEIRSALAISGIHDLAPIRRLAVNDKLRLSAGEVNAHSPVRRTPPRAGRLRLAVGDGEGPEFLRQQRALADAWRRPGHPCDEIVLGGADHFSILDDLADPEGLLFRAAITAIRR